MKEQAFDRLFSICKFGTIHVQHPEGTDWWWISSGAWEGVGRTPEEAILNMKGGDPYEDQERRQEGR